MKENKNLQFLKLLNAGHMVPLDIPQQSLEMMSNFMYGKSFDQSPQSINPQAKEDSCPVCPGSTCDVCEDCASLQSTGDDLMSVSATPATSRVQHNYLPWTIAALAVLSLLIVSLTSRKHTRQHQELVSEYDLELREGSYSDRQGGKGDKEII
jgi:hypothetical protein